MALSACQYPMAESVSTGGSVSDVPARSSTGCASGFQSRSPREGAQRGGGVPQRLAELRAARPAAPGSGQASSSAVAAAVTACSTLPGAR